MSPQSWVSVPHMLGWAAALWFGVAWSFVAIMNAKRVLGISGLSLFWRVMLVPLGVIGLVLDFAFNVTFGTAMFVELPRELLFSARVQRHYLKGDRLARWWAVQLNTFDPSHIHEARE
jgi:hypothetical protein